MIKWFKNNYLLAINFFLVYLGLIIFIVIPYLIYNNITQWDSVGHLYSSWYIKEYLFPLPIGWNPNFFLGFPQGTFYPPFFHYTVALLSFVFPIKIAFKLLVSFSVLITPISFYYFSKAYTKSRAISSTSMFGMTAMLIAPLVYSTVNNYIGGNFASTFNIGLVTNALALPLYFFYLGSLKNNFSKSTFIVPSLLLSLLIITHTITALMAVLYFIIFSLLFVRRKKHFKYIFNHTLLVALLCSWWVVPFLVFFPYSDTTKVSIMIGGGSFITIILGLLSSMIIFMKKIQGMITPVVLFLVITIGSLFLNFFNIDLHTYRFIFFALLLVPLFFTKIISKKYLIIASIFFLIISIWGYNYKIVDIKGPQIKKQTPMKTADLGRTFILADGIEDSSPHYFQHSLPRENNFPAVKGLFVESSINSKYLMNLERLLDSSSFVWGVDIYNFSKLSETKKNVLIENHLKNFGIQNILTHKIYSAFSDYNLFDEFTYNRPGKVWIFEDQSYKIPVFNFGSYFVDTKDYLFYVIHKPTEIRYVAYKPLGDYYDSMILESSEETFYINRHGKRSFTIDFYLDDSVPKIDKVKALNKLKDDLEIINITKSKKELLDADIEMLEAELYETDLQYAKTKYASSTEVAIEKVWEKTLRLDELRTQDQDEKIDFFMYKIPDSELIQILDYIPENIDKNWEVAIDSWFFGSNTDKILIQKSEPFTNLTSDADIDNIKISEKQDKLNFSINSDKAVPILIKVSYFPKWQAKSNGNEIPIYRASPNLMFIYANGDIELTYSTKWYEYLGIILSILGLIWIGYIKIKNYVIIK